MFIRDFAYLVKLVIKSEANSEQNLIARFDLLRMIASKLLPEYRFKWPQLLWWESSEFNEYLNSFNELNGNNSDRRLAVSQLIRLTSSVPGDTVEVGSYQGAMSWLICQANDGHRMHHIFDSFEGLSEPALVDGQHWEAGALACAESVVKDNLKKFNGSFLTYRGWVPERFSEVADRSFSFVHIDVDLFDPTFDSLEFFYPRLCSGGILVCDDYGVTTCPGATRACDDYLKDKPESMIQLADGGGFFVKGIQTGGKSFL
jgi:O-methyltransferase